MSLFSEADLEFSPEEVSQHNMQLRPVVGILLRLRDHVWASLAVYTKFMADCMHAADGVLCRRRGDNSHS